MEAGKNFLLFLSIAIGGVLLEVLISELHYRLTKKHYKENHYSFGKYLFLLSLPLLAVMVMVGRVGTTLLNVFFIFAIAGTVIEWIIGFSYHKVIGQRLWTYHRYTITKYTSFLSIPIWGLGGVLFWLLIQVFG